ncbi:MAG: DegV family protein [Chloroflexi bacterium]|nr:DegV family protein [Chloroflexota bacterium]
MAIRIVTDSVADLPPDVARANEISVVPLYVLIGGEAFRDGIDIDADAFYSRLITLAKLPTTSQPSALDFADVYRRLIDQGHDIVSIHVSSKLSGTLNSAELAKSAIGEPHRIEIVDSLLAGGSQGLLTLSASGWAKEMTSHIDVAQRVRESASANFGYITVDTLKYLKMGGRIGKAQAFLGGLLDFKPIVCVRDGEVHPVERPRTRRRAIARLTSIVRDLAPIRSLHVSYTTGAQDAVVIRDALADLVDPDALVESRFGPVLGTHLGPNTIGVAVTRANSAGY